MVNHQHILDLPTSDWMIESMLFQNEQSGATAVAAKQLSHEEAESFRKDLADHVDKGWLNARVKETDGIIRLRVTQAEGGKSQILEADISIRLPKRATQL